MKVRRTFVVAGSLMREALDRGEPVVLDAGSVFGLCAVTEPGRTEPQRLLTAIKKRPLSKVYGSLGTEEDILRQVDLSCVSEETHDLFTPENLKIFRDVFLRFPVRKAPYKCSLHGKHQIMQPLDRKVLRLVRFFEGKYFLATSFNVSGFPSATRLTQVEKYLQEMDSWYQGRLVVSCRWQRYLFPRLFRSSGSMAIFEVVSGGLKLRRPGTGQKRVVKLLRQRGLSR